MPLISSVTVASFAGVGAAKPAGRTNPTRTNPRPTTDAPFFISTTSGADYTTRAMGEIIVGEQQEQQAKPSCERKMARHWLRAWKALRLALFVE